MSKVEVCFKIGDSYVTELPEEFKVQGRFYNTIEMHNGRTYVIGFDSHINRECILVESGGLPYKIYAGVPFATRFQPL